jgi:hypothetical protein
VFAARPVHRGIGKITDVLRQFGDATNIAVLKTPKNSRLEMAAIVCFLWVADVSNRRAVD